MSRPNRPSRGQSGRDRRPDRRDKEANSAGERLQKVLAAAGVGSRRDCEELITEGRVEVDRKVVTELGTRVDPVAQEIRVDGEQLKQPKRMYFAVNKPTGVVTTNYDPSGRARVIDLVPTEERLFAVGRLDRASEGLILVTNDGEFANRLTHPRYGVDKTYLVRVAGSPTTAEIEKLRKGVHLSDGFCKIDSIKVKGRHKQSTDMVMVLSEGRNREVRRVLAKVGHKVVQLKRIAVGKLKLGEMPTGAWRKLQPSEVTSLLSEAQEKRRTTRPRPQTARSPATAAEGGEFKPPRGKRPENRYKQAQERMIPEDEELMEDLIIDDVGDDYDDDEIVDFRSDDAPGSSVPRGDVLDYGDDEFTAEYGTGASFSHDAVESRPREDRERSHKKVNRPSRRAAEGALPRTSQRSTEKPAARKPFGAKPAGKKPTGAKPFGDKPAARRKRGAKATGRPGGGKPFGGKGGKPAGGKPFGGKGGPKKKGRR